MQWHLLLPLASIFVLPIGRLEYALLRRSPWGALLAGFAVAALYAPWLIGAALESRRNPSGIALFIGGGLIATGLIVWLNALPRLLGVTGQRYANPQALVTEGAYSWTRHPLYLGHVVVISGLVLCLGAPKLFLETPLLWLIAAIAAGYEERQILAPRFANEYAVYRRYVPFFLTAGAWVVWGIFYFAVVILATQGLL